MLKSPESKSRTSIYTTVHVYTLQYIVKGGPVKSQFLQESP